MTEERAIELIKIAISLAKPNTEFLKSMQTLLHCQCASLQIAVAKNLEDLLLPLTIN